MWDRAAKLRNPLRMSRSRSRSRVRLYHHVSEFPSSGPIKPHFHQLTHFSRLQYGWNIHTEVHVVLRQLCTSLQPQVSFQVLVLLERLSHIVWWRAGVVIPECYQTCLSGFPLRNAYTVGFKSSNSHFSVWFYRHFSSFITSEVWIYRQNKLALPRQQALRATFIFLNARFSMTPCYF